MGQQKAGQAPWDVGSKGQAPAQSDFVAKTPGTCLCTTKNRKVSRNVHRLILEMEIDVEGDGILLKLEFWPSSHQQK